MARDSSSRSTVARRTGTSCPLPSKGARVLIEVRCTGSQLSTAFVRMDDEVSLLDAAALQSWPIIPRRAGVQIIVHEDAGSTTTYRLLMDQARCLGLTRGSMGCGLKVVSSTHPGRAALPFCVVARCSSRARVEEALALCVGGELGYGLLERKNSVVIYDIARSPAYLLNHHRGATHKMSLLPRHPWATFKARKRLREGQHLFAPYGRGSDLHAAIAKDVAERAERSPVCNQRRAELCDAMRALAAKRWEK